MPILQKSYLRQVERLHKFPKDMHPKDQLNVNSQMSHLLFPHWCMVGEEKETPQPNNTGPSREPSKGNPFTAHGDT